MTETIASEASQETTSRGGVRLRMLYIPLWLGVFLILIQAIWLTFSLVQQATLASASTPPQIEAPTRPEPPVHPPQPAQSPDDSSSVQVELADQSGLASDGPAQEYYSQLARMNDNAIVQSVSSAMVEALFEVSRPAAEFEILSKTDTTAPVDAEPVEDDPSAAELSDAEQINAEPPGVVPSDAEPTDLAAADTGTSDAELVDVPDDIASPEANIPAADNSLVLVNGQERVGTISFLVDGKVHTLAPGEWRKFDDEADHVVRFHRGGDLGQALHELSTGTYHFNVSRDGWTLSTTAP